MAALVQAQENGCELDELAGRPEDDQDHPGGARESPTGQQGQAAPHADTVRGGVDGRERSRPRQSRSASGRPPWRRRLPLRRLRRRRSGRAPAGATAANASTDTHREERRRDREEARLRPTVAVEEHRPSMNRMPHERAEASFAGCTRTRTNGEMWMRSRSAIHRITGVSSFALRRSEYAAPEGVERLLQEIPRREEAGRPLRVAVEIVGVEARRPRIVEVARARRAPPSTFRNAPYGLPSRQHVHVPVPDAPPRPAADRRTNARLPGRNRTRPSSSSTDSPRAAATPARRASKRPRFGCETTRQRQPVGQLRCARPPRSRPSSRRRRGRARRRSRSARPPSTSASIVARRCGASSCTGMTTLSEALTLLANELVAACADTSGGSAAGRRPPPCPRAPARRPPSGPRSP